MIVEVRAPYKPTEDPRKVERAIANLFPDLETRTEEGMIVATGSSVERFGARLQEQRIRSAARAVLVASRSGNKVKFTLNKQVAFVGKISFGSGSPLGDIEVEIEDEEIDEVVDSIAPRLEGSE